MAASRAIVRPFVWDAARNLGDPKPVERSPVRVDESSRAIWASLFLALAALGAYRVPARAEDFYVAADGNDGNPGTMAQPFATVERGADRRFGGRHRIHPRRRLSLQRDAGHHRCGVHEERRIGQPIKYFAYAGERPIFDLFELARRRASPGLDVRGNWIHIRGLEVRGVRQLIVGDSWGVRIRGDHNVIEQLEVHDCEAPGSSSRAAPPT